MFKHHSARLHLVDSLLLFSTVDRYIKRFESKSKRKRKKERERFGSKFAHNEETAVLVHQQAYFSMGRGRDTLLEAAIRAKSWKGVRYYRKRSDVVLYRDAGRSWPDDGPIPTSISTVLLGRTKGSIVRGATAIAVDNSKEKAKEGEICLNWLYYWLLINRSVLKWRLCECWKYKFYRVCEIINYFECLFTFFFF